jgi:hypothetical protein
MGLFGKITGGRVGGGRAAGKVFGDGKVEIGRNCLSPLSPIPAHRLAVMT